MVQIYRSSILGEAGSAISKNRGQLPSKYITKKEAQQLGWKPKQGNLHEVAPGKSIGGDLYGNRNLKLPNDKTYKEADLGYSSGYRGKERMVYSTDGKKVYITDDHYETFAEVVL